MRKALAILLSLVVAASVTSAYQKRLPNRAEIPQISRTTNKAPLANIETDGQPQGFKEGESHRYFLWRDSQGWHLRTTTALRKHRFRGEIVTNGGKINDFKTFDLEGRSDWTQLTSDRGRVYFDLTTDKGLDGFDFTTDAQTISFNVTLDGRARPEVVFVGTNNDHPGSMPFSLNNGRHNNNNNNNSSGNATNPSEISAFGQPQGMGAGSSRRYIIWRDNNTWHLRTTTSRKSHIFAGEIIAEGGKISDVHTVSNERNDWVLNPNGERVSFDLKTQGEIDGFDFQTNARRLTFRLSVDGESRGDLIYIGSQGSNPANVPFTLSTR